MADDNDGGEAPRERTTIVETGGGGGGGVLAVVLLIIVVLGIRHATALYFEGALLIALLGFVSSAALAKFLLRGEVIEP